MRTDKMARLDPAALATNPRCSVASWLKYEGTVRAAFAIHPKEYRFTPTNMAAATVASRVREAVRGALTFHHPSEIAHSDLSRWWSETCVRHAGLEVIIGPMGKDVVALTAVRPPSSDGYSFHSLSFEEVTAFAVLLATGKISGPIRISNPPDMTLINQPNVEVVPQKDGSVVLL